MDRDITQGVEVHAGFSACDRPLAVLWKGERQPIAAIVAEWREPQAKCYRVRTEQNSDFLLRFEDDIWHITPA